MTHITMAHIEDVASQISSHNCIFIGGSALPFYGVEIHTVDIDLEIQGVTSLDELNKLQSTLDDCSVDVELSTNVSGWSMIPLPKGYRDRVRPTPLENVFVLDPVDYVLSKMRRGTSKDIEASLAVCKAQDISIHELESRIDLIELPIDLASNMFSKQMKCFFEELQTYLHPSNSPHI